MARELISAAVEAWLKEHESEAIGWRRYLHEHPELSHEEFATTDFIVEKLEAVGLTPVRLASTGLYVDIGEPDADGHRLAIRADMDALPIEEATGLAYSSVVPGVSHACGHDLHITVALATACALATCADALTPGVRIVFQPAEEVMDGGAPEVIAQGVLESIAAIYAIHAEPKLKVGSIGVRTGAITSAGDVVEITVTGPGGHTSRPQQTADVVFGMSQLVTELPALLSRRVDPRTGTVLVFGSIHAGHAANAIPKEGTLMGTIRTADIRVWRTIQPLMEELIGQVLAPTGCAYSINYIRGVPPVVNDEVATAILAAAAGTSAVQAPQSSGGEDFSWYLEHVPGSMARLGCWSGEGDKKDLHCDDMLVDDRAIAVGVRLFASIASRFRENHPGLGQ